MHEAKTLPKQPKPNQKVALPNSDLAWTCSFSSSLVQVQIDYKVCKCCADNTPLVLCTMHCFGNGEANSMAQLMAGETLLGLFLFFNLFLDNQMNGFLCEQNFDEFILTQNCP